MATSATGGWDITTLDSGNDCGRFSSLLLDPNRPTVTKWAVAYENTTNGQVKLLDFGVAKLLDSDEPKTISRVWLALHTPKRTQRLSNCAVMSWARQRTCFR